MQRVVQRFSEFHHRHQIDHHRYEFIFHLVKIHQYKYQIFRTPYANGDAQGQGRVPRHRELDPDKLFRKIYPYVRGDGKQLHDYWDADVISTAVARNSSLSDGVEHPAPFQRILFTYQFLWRLKRVTWHLIRLWGLERLGAFLTHTNGFLWV